MQKKINIPEDGIWILQRLQSHGYTAYAVGGCIRDTLLHSRMTGTSARMPHRNKYRHVFLMCPVSLWESNMAPSVF